MSLYIANSLASSGRSQTVFITFDLMVGGKYRVSDTSIAGLDELRLLGAIIVNCSN